MRKAVQAARLGGKSRSRNGKNDDRESAREGGSIGSNGNSDRGNNGNGNNGMEHMMMAMPPVKLRKTTPEEAALTAKNYRLAKELSELRVRHREECKNSTRLTMENMNLASRCREAISHVAMLKKDLATSQRRTAEVIHNYQRQQQVQQQQQQQHQGVGGGGAASTANTSVATSSRQPQQPPLALPNEIVFVPGTDTLASTAAAAPRSAEKASTTGAAQPSPRALNVARDLEQMDELLLHNNAAAGSTVTPTNGSSSSSMREPDAPPTVAAAAGVPSAVQTMEPLSPKATPPSRGEGPAAAAPSLVPILLTINTESEAELLSGTENVVVGVAAGGGAISPSSYPLSEPIDSDDFEDIYNQAEANDASILLSSTTALRTTPAAAAAMAAASASTPTTTPPMSPSTKPPLMMGNNNNSNKNDLDEDDDNDGEDPSDIMGDTTRRTGGPSGSKLAVSAFFPHSASPKLGRGGVGAGGYNEEFPGDITAASARKASSTRSRLGRLSGFAEMDDETGGGIIPPNINNSLHHPLSGGSLSDHQPSSSKMGVFDNRAMLAARGGGAQDKSTLSSIDAFEASFRTDFPETFSPRESTISEEKKSSTGEPYNPFFPSPQKGRPEAESASSSSSAFVGGTSSGVGAFKTGFVASLVAASKDNAAAAAAQQEQQHLRDSSLSPTAGLQPHHRFFESKRSKDPPGKDRTSPRSLMKNTGVVTDISPKQKMLASLQALSTKDSLASPRNASSASSPRASSTSALLQRRSTPVTPTSQQKSPGFAAAASATLPSLDLEKFRSPNPFNSKASSTPTIVTNNSTPTTPLSPARSSPTNENSGSGSGSVLSATAAAAAAEPKRPEKTGYDLARLRYEKALANRKTRTPNFDNADTSSATSSQGTAKSSSQPRRSSIDSASNSSNNDAVSKPPTTPKENKNNANSASSSSIVEAAVSAATTDTMPPNTIVTSQKSSRSGPSEPQSPTKSQSTSSNTTTSSPSKIAIVDGQPVVSVRDRLSLFSDRTPRSPEKEAARLQAIANGRRFDLDTSYEDEGDIPLLTSINRKGGEETASPAEVSNSTATTTTTSSSTTVLPRNKPFAPKSPGNSSINSGGSGGGAGTTPKSYINGLTRHRPWDSNNMNTANNDEMDFDPTADPKISVSSTTAADAAATTLNSHAGLSKPRRSIAHPVSYAEPSLRTKLRNGDMFFPKDEGAFYTASTTTTTTTTTPPVAATTTNHAE